MVKTKAPISPKPSVIISNNLLIGLLAVIVLASTWIFTRDLLTPILVGIIFAILTYPVYTFFIGLLEKVLPKNNISLSATLTIIMISSLLIFILNFCLIQLQNEIPFFARSLSNFVTALPENDSVIELFRLSPEQAKDISEAATANLNKFQANFSDAGTVFTNLLAEQNIGRTLEIGQRTLVQISDLIISLLFFIFVWYNTLVNGNTWQKNLFNLFPFTNQEQNSIRKDIKTAVKNVIYAELGAGLIHATAVFAMLSIFNIENRFIITFIVFLIGVLPLSPAEFAYAIPISLIFPRNPLAALLLIPIAEIIILWINFVYRPKLIAETNDANPILVLASIFSGIAIFGVLGFLIGPVLMIITQSLYNVLANRLKQGNTEQQKA